MMPDKIKRHHVVHVAKGKSEQTGVVQWAGSDGRGQRHALVRFDHSGSLVLMPVHMLKIVVLDAGEG